MALKVLNFQNFSNPTGYDLEVVGSSTENLYRSIVGIPLVGSQPISYTSGNLLSLQNVLVVGDIDVWTSYSYGENISRFAFSKTDFGKRFYLVSTQGSLSQGLIVALQEPNSFITSVHALNSNIDNHMIDTGNNRVAFFSRNHTQIFWKFEDNLTGSVNYTPTGTIIINNPRVFMFWKNYWYIASPNDNRIQVLAPDFSTTVGTLNLAVSEGVYALMNISDVYLGIVVIAKNSFEIPRRLYLWDGNWQNIYFHRLSFNKELTGSVIYEGKTYLFLTDKNNTEVYSFSASGMRLVRRFNNCRTVQLTGIHNHPLSSISTGKNFIVIPNYYSPIPDNKYGILIWYPEDDIVTSLDYKLLSSKNAVGYFSLATSNYVHVFYINDENTRMKWMTIDPSNYAYVAASGVKEDFYLETNWLNLNNSQYVKILAIEVFTDNLQGRNITAQILYKDEKRSGGEILVYDLPNINKSGYQRIENIGIIATKFKLKFSYRGNSSHYPFVFKRVLVYFDDEI